MKTLFSLILAVSVLSASLTEVYAQDEPAETTTAKKVAKKKGFPFKYEKSLKKALAKAKKLNVPVMLLYTNPATCPYCVKLEEEVLNTKEWKKGVAGKLIGVYIDSASKDKEARAFREQNGVSGIPTFFILDPNGAVISRGGYTRGPVSSYVDAVDKAFEKVQATAGVDSDAE